jgi:hypothetical protein
MGGCLFWESREIAGLPPAKAMETWDQSAGMPMSGRNQSGNIWGASLRLVSPRADFNAASSHPRIPL